MTAYEYLQGQPASERLAFFGETISFSDPQRRRSNLDLRWAVGVVLGTLMTSSEALIGMPNGDVTRTGAIARLIPNLNRRPGAMRAITGTLAKPTNSGYDDAVIECLANPHLRIDDEQRRVLDGDDGPVPVDLPLCRHSERKLPSLRIT